MTPGFLSGLYLINSGRVYTSTRLVVQFYVAKSSYHWNLQTTLVTNFHQTSLGQLLARSLV